MSIRLYVGNLPKELDRKELEELFTQEIGDLTSTKVVTDRKTGKCRGFGFVTVETSEQADQAIEKLNGHMFKDSPLKIEIAQPKAKEDGDAHGEGHTASSGRRNSSSGKGKSRRPATGTSHSSQPEAAQPDPRWAQELEKLKEILAAQANNT